MNADIIHRQEIEALAYAGMPVGWQMPFSRCQQLKQWTTPNSDYVQQGHCLYVMQNGVINMAIRRALPEERGALPELLPGRGHDCTLNQYSRSHCACFLDEELSVTSRLPQLTSARLDHGSSRHDCVGLARALPLPTQCEVVGVW